MTKEELEKEAQRSFDELDDWCVGDDWSIEESYKNGYSNGAEPREKRITELEAQIEKMKQDLDKAIESANKQKQWEIYSVLNDIYNDNFEVITSVSN